MTKFYLVRQDNGRVILHTTVAKSDTVLEEIEAANWLAARKKVKEYKFYHVPGYGWYER